MAQGVWIDVATNGYSQAVWNNSRPAKSFGRMTLGTVDSTSVFAIALACDCAFGSVREPLRPACTSGFAQPNAQRREFLTCMRSATAIASQVFWDSRTLFLKRDADPRLSALRVGPAMVQARQFSTHAGGALAARRQYSPCASSLRKPLRLERQIFADSANGAGMLSNSHHGNCVMAGGGWIAGLSRAATPLNVGWRASQRCQCVKLISISTAESPSTGHFQAIYLRGRLVM